MVEPEKSKKTSGTRSAAPATIAERREAELSDGLEAYLRAQLYDATADVLCEAKGSSRRESVRMALGQLLDYSRFVHSEASTSTPRRAVLLPSLPDEDLQDLLAGHAVSIVYPGPEDGVFIGVPDPS